MYDENKRSILKAVTWRIIATLTTIILVYIFTGELVLSLGVGFIEVVLKVIFYFLHERVWMNIGFGKK